MELACDIVNIGINGCDVSLSEEEKEFGDICCSKLFELSLSVVCSKLQSTSLIGCWLSTCLSLLNVPVCSKDISDELSELLELFLIVVVLCRLSCREVVFMWLLCCLPTLISSSESRSSSWCGHIAVCSSDGEWLCWSCPISNSKGSVWTDWLLMSLTVCDGFVVSASAVLSCSSISSLYNPDKYGYSLKLIFSFSDSRSIGDSRSLDIFLS